MRAHFHFFVIFVLPYDYMWILVLLTLIMRFLSRWNGATTRDKTFVLAGGGILMSLMGRQFLILLMVRQNDFVGLLIVCEK